MDIQPTPMVVHEEEVHSHEHANPRAETTRNDINLYLQLLRDELHKIWTEGVSTWDVVAENYFPMRAALITTVQDYLGYGYIAG